jgi:hypothetical protein
VAVAFVDLPGFIADLKEHAIEHGFHVHDERHFVETYSLRQTWEVDLHPEEACGGPLDLHLALEADPRVTLGFEDAMVALPEGDLPDDSFHVPLVFAWAMPPMQTGPDLLVLATDLAGVAGPELPLQVSAIDGVVDVVDAPERTLAITARVELSLRSLFTGEQSLCDVLDRAKEVSEYLLDHAETWVGEWPVDNDED